LSALKGENMEDTTNDGMSLFDMGEDIQLNFDDLGLEPDDNTGDNPDDKPITGDDDGAGVPDSGQENVISEDNINPDGEGDDADGDDTPNIYSSFTKVLSEQGLLPDLDLSKTNVEDVDGLTEVLKTQIDAQAKNYIIDKLGEDGFNAIEKGVTLQEYQQHQSTMDTFESITEDLITEDIELSKRLIYQDLINQGLSESKASRYLQKSIDLGDDSVIEDAKEALGSLKEYEARRLEQVQAQRAQEYQNAIKEQEKLDNDLKNYIYGKDELIKGAKVSKGMQDKIYESMNKTVAIAPDGTRLNGLMQARQNNPIEFDTKLYYLYELTNGFSDFSKISTKSASKATSDLERSLRNTSFNHDGQANYLSDSESYDSSFGDFLHLD